MKLGFDIMGGDYAPKATVGGALLASNEISSEDRIVLFGDIDVISNEIKTQSGDTSIFDIVHCPDVITMGEHPTKALTQKPKSSIAMAFKYLAEGKIDAFSSAGNTGAMLVGSIYSVKPIEGIIRPCTATMIPKESGKKGILLDVGTNPDGKPELLYQFAVIGSIYAKYVYGIDNPKVGLLNLGEEEEKGNLLTQATFKLMKGTKDFNFIGNVESRELFKDKADVFVCDGFTGNIILKQVEAMYRIMMKRGFIDDFVKSLNYENYGGTPILGVNGTVEIGHGISNDVAIKNMILHSKEVFEVKLSEKIKSALNK